MKIDNSYQESFTVNYDVSNDGKTDPDIQDAKFFLFRFPGEPDDRYFVKTLGNGLSYSAGVWTVTHEQRDLDKARGGYIFHGCLAIQYAGETYFREVKGDRLTETVEGSEVPLKITVIENAAD